MRLTHAPPPALPAHRAELAVNVVQTSPASINSAYNQQEPHAAGSLENVAHPGDRRDHHARNCVRGKHGKAAAERPAGSGTSAEATDLHPLLYGPVRSGPLGAPRKCCGVLGMHRSAPNLRLWPPAGGLAAAAAAGRDPRAPPRPQTCSPLQAQRQDCRSQGQGGRAEEQAVRQDWQADCAGGAAGRTRRAGQFAAQRRARGSQGGAGAVCRLLGPPACVLLMAGISNTQRLLVWRQGQQQQAAGWWWWWWCVWVVCVCVWVCGGGGPAHPRLLEPRFFEATSADLHAIRPSCHQVPVDIIDRNIKRASESKADYAEIT